MAKQVASPVPTISSATGIQDPATRRAIQDLADAHNTRNGRTKERFITEADLKGLAPTIVSYGMRELGGLPGGDGGAGAPPGWGSNGEMIDALGSLIAKDPFFQKLGERIEWLNIKTKDLSGVTSLNLSKIASLGEGFISERIERLEGEDRLLQESRGLKVQIGENFAAFLDEVTARMTADEAVASQITTLGARIGGSEAAIQTEASARATGDLAIASQISTVSSRVSAAEAAIQTESSARTTSDSALATQITTVDARLGQTQAAVETEKVARATADSALTARIDTLLARTGQNEAAIQVSQQTQTNWNAAAAQSITTLQTQVVMPDGTPIRNQLQEEYDARSEADGNLAAHHAIKIDQNGWVSGYGLMSTTSPNSPATSAFYIRADRFAIGSPAYHAPDGTSPPEAYIPFAVQTTSYTDPASGEVFPAGVYMKSSFLEYASIDEAHIIDASVSTLKIQGEAVVVPRYNAGGTSTSITINGGADGLKFLAVASFVNGTGEQGMCSIHGGSGVNQGIVPGGSLTIMCDGYVYPNENRTITASTTLSHAASMMVVMGAKR